MKCQFCGGNPEMPLENHPDFALMAGTPEKPLNRSVWTAAGKFLHFCDGSPYYGMRTYIAMDCDVHNPVYKEVLPGESIEAGDEMAFKFREEWYQINAVHYGLPSNHFFKVRRKLVTRPIDRLFPVMAVKTTGFTPAEKIYNWAKEMANMSGYCAASMGVPFDTTTEDVKYNSKLSAGTHWGRFMSSGRVATSRAGMPALDMSSLTAIRRSAKVFTRWAMRNIPRYCRLRAEAVKLAQSGPTMRERSSDIVGISRALILRELISEQAKVAKLEDEVKSLRRKVVTLADVVTSGPKLREGYRLVQDDERVVAHDEFWSTMLEEWCVCEGCLGIPKAHGYPTMIVRRKCKFEV